MNHASWSPLAGGASSHNLAFAFSCISVQFSVPIAIMQVTKTAVAAQDEERKAFMGSIRDCLAAKVRSGQEWHDVIGRHTHPGSIWHFADRDAVRLCRVS